MKAVRQKERVILKFNFLECTILRRAFAEVISHYKKKPEEMDPKLSAAWYSTRGCRSAKMSPQEMHDWLATLHEYKSANLARLDLWNNALKQRQSGQYQLDLSLEEAASLVTILNDYRLLLATQHDIGQDEMDLRDADELFDLKAPQQKALYSIHFLACVIEELLRLISPEAASWLDEDVEP